MEVKRPHSLTFLTRIDYFTKDLNPDLIHGLMRQEYSTGYIEPQEKILKPLINVAATCMAPHVELEKAQTAFGRWAMPKLKQELLHHDLTISRQALIAVLDFVHDPERAVEAVKINVHARLVRLMVSKDKYTRQHAICVIRVLSTQPACPLALVQNRFILKNLKKALYDEDVIVRIQATITVGLLGRCWFSNKQIVESGFVMYLLGRICCESVEVVKIPLLTALEYILEKSDCAKYQAVEADAVVLLAPYIIHIDSQIRAGAIAVLVQLFITKEGKLAGEKCPIDLIDWLSNALLDESEDVIEQSALALAFLFVTTPCKFRGVDLKVLDNLLPLALRSCHKAISRNAMQAITTLAAAPVIKEKLLEHHLEDIKQIDTQKKLDLHEFKYRLIEVIEHKV